VEAVSATAAAEALAGGEATELRNASPCLSFSAVRRKCEGSLAQLEIAVTTSNGPDALVSLRHR